MISAEWKRLFLWLNLILWFSIGLISITDKIIYAQSLQNHDKSSDQRVMELMRRGGLLEKQGAVDEAIAVYERVIQEYPTATYEDEVVDEGMYSEDARERLNVLHCLKAKGHDFSTKSREAMVKVIKKAFQSRDIKALIQYGSCDFYIGKPETDSGWYLLPDQVMSVIIGIGKTLEWSSLLFNPSGSFFTVQTRKGKEEHIFVLSNISDRWIWDGYYTLDNKILDHLWAIKKPDK